MNLPSNIRVSIQFKQSTVFAGEDVECIITFRNIAQGYGNDNAHDLPSYPQRRVPTITARRPSASRHSSGGVPTQRRRSHRTTLSSSTPNTPNPRDEHNGEISAVAVARRGHGRSLSIRSMSSSAQGGDEWPRQDAEPSARRPGRGHMRTTSLQTGSRRGLNSPLIGPSLNGASIHHSPQVETPTISLQDAPHPNRPFRNNSARSNGLEPSVPLITPAGSGSLRQDQLPPTPSDDTSVSDVQHPQTQATEASENGKSPTRGNLSRLPDLPSGTQESPLNPITRLIAASSVNGTPRSSIDLYSMSNHSDETLASEYPTQPFVRQSVRSGQFRQGSRLEEVDELAGPETLMMGYAQVMGSFTLDGSLVNQAPFEEVKRKGVVGGQGGGGVVGLDSKKRESGLFGALGWSNIGESLGGLLGGGELSSIKEMRSIANSKTIPLLSTPHSILFVDLQLAPGEIKRYSYSFTLPIGLPPTHKGRAMKVSYHITVGIQRPGSGAGHRVRSLDIPFRVFSTVNGRGEILGHDLLAPHIFLRDVARTCVVSEEPKPNPTSDSDIASLLNYVNALVEKPAARSGLLSPTSPLSPSLHFRRGSSISEPTTCKEAIDLAIIRSTQTSSISPSNTSLQPNLSTRFSIARSTRPVATLLFPRTAYRLGETIHLIIDFSPSPFPNNNAKDGPKTIDTPPSPIIPVYAVLVTLETAEGIDPAIAMRSPQSVQRYTRKVHAQSAESAMFARRLSFALGVPPTATPEFGTTGVGLEWKVRVEFVTPRLHIMEKTAPREAGSEFSSDEEGRELDENEWGDLLEEVGRDDRGVMLQGVERLTVETFEVAVPVRVYGAVVGNKAENDVEDMAL